MKAKGENRTQEMIEELAQGMAHSFMRLQKYMDKRFERIEERLDKHDRQFELIDIQFGNIDKKFQQVDRKFVDLHYEFAKVHERLDDLNNKVETYNKYRTEDVDALADDIIAHDKRIRTLEKKVAKC